MIETVLGPIDATDLGATSMHDHLVIDSRGLQAPAREPIPDERRVTMENLGFLRWNLLALEDNLVLDDDELASSEVRRAVDCGLGALVDLTSWGLGPQPHRLPAISRAAGLHVIAGVGVYLDRPHPGWVGELDDDALADVFVASIREEYAGAGFRAGIIGVVGTGEPVTPSERRVLDACGAASGVTGVPITIRLDASARRGLEVLEWLDSVGCQSGNVIFGNVDEFLDVDYLVELAAAGATLEWCFGNEAYYRDGYKDPTDYERLDALLGVIARGHVERCVLGCSVWTKTQLKAFGGMGYDHVLRRILPELSRRGVTDDVIDRMMVVNPARLLDH
jgi:phosphotriesterase-related protein